MKTGKSCRKWTPEEIEELRRDYGKYPNKELAVRFGRSEDTIQSKAQELALTRRICKWTSEKTEKLRMDYKTFSLSELADRFGVSTGAIREKAREMGLWKQRYGCFPKEMVNKINELAEDYTDKEIAEILGLKYGTVKYKRAQKKTKEWVNKKNGEIAIKGNYCERLLSSDKTICMFLAGGKNGSGRVAASKIYLQHPHLIELKRNQLLLNCELKKMNL